jgi:hypothetical protein
LQLPFNPFPNPSPASSLGHFSILVIRRRRLDLSIDDDNVLDPLLRPYSQWLRERGLSVQVE